MKGNRCRPPVHQQVADNTFRQNQQHADAGSLSAMNSNSMAMEALKRGLQAHQQRTDLSSGNSQDFYKTALMAAQASPSGGGSKMGVGKLANESAMSILRPEVQAAADCAVKNSDMEAIPETDRGVSSGWLDSVVRSANVLGEMSYEAERNNPIAAMMGWFLDGEAKAERVEGRLEE